MRIFIITEGNSELGFGHISRCNSMYQAFQEKEILPCMIINGDDSVIPLIEGKNYNILDWINEFEKLVNITKGSDCIIIDSYVAPVNLYLKLSQNTKLSVFIDDNNRISYPSGMIINSSIHANDLNYPLNEDKEYLLGSEYCMLNKPFWEDQNKEIKENIENILITFGGNDLRNLTPKILQEVSFKFPALKKKVIIGKGFKNQSEIKRVQDKNTQLIYYPNAEGMKAVMSESDIAISAAGQTSYELASVGVPAILVAMVDNQLKSAEKCGELGINFYAGWWQEENLLVKIMEYLNKLKDLNVRKKIIKKGKEIIKADGSRRAVKLILNKLKEIRY